MLLDSLHLDARQRAMLKAMGITHWWPQTAPAATAEAAKDEPADASVPPTTRQAGADSFSIADSYCQSSVEADFPSKSRSTTASATAPTGTQPVVSASATTAPPSATARTQPASQPPVADAPARRPVADLRQLDWDGLTAAIEGCEACGLCQGRQRAVPGMGPRRARWMIVGEAPGEQEDRQGLPFVGPAGQLLDAMLAAMGLTREADVYIANVIKCRPPHNRNPDPAEVAQCQPYLLRQIELVQPELILAMGRFAAQTLLAGTVAQIETLPLGKLRGSIHTVTLPNAAQALPVVVTYHPAYLLRNPADKGKVWQDLCLAMDRLGHNPLDTPTQQPPSLQSAP